MDNKVEKLLNMLTAESIKVLETDDLALIEHFYLETERYIKTNHEKIKKQREALYIDQLGDKEEAEINGWIVSYKQTERFALDNTKIRDQYKNLTDEEFKNLFYSHSFTKASLKMKAKK